MPGRPFIESGKSFLLSSDLVRGPAILFALWINERCLPQTDGKWTWNGTLYKVSYSTQEIFGVFVTQSDNALAKNAIKYQGVCQGFAIWLSLKCTREGSNEWKFQGDQGKYRHSSNQIFQIFLNDTKDIDHENVA